jgi:hypothetical protein
VGVSPGTALPIVNDVLIAEEAQLERTGYIVVGDATTLDGLAAPYDEEDTQFIMKHEDVPVGSNVFRSWFDHPNADHFSGRRTMAQEFA